MQRNDAREWSRARGVEQHAVQREIGLRDIDRLAGGRGA
jgi:hypothetical protein